VENKAMLHERIELITAVKQGDASRKQLQAEVSDTIVRFVEHEFGIPPERYAGLGGNDPICNLTYMIVRELTGSI
jgi:hypothetical protein